MGTNEFLRKFAATAGLVSGFLTSGLLSTSVLAQEPLFDEIRFGFSASIQEKQNFEPGLFPSATVFFDPFNQREAQGFVDQLLRPRLHVGAIVSTAGGANQAYAGFTWTANISDRIFIDLGFGGSVTDASLDDPAHRPNVGCRVQFHESAGLGYNITQNWRVLATIEHSSNADLCDQNDGLTYAGFGVGYKF